jgi:hypothetical protein
MCARLHLFAETCAEFAEAIRAGLGELDLRQDISADILKLFIQFCERNPPDLGSRPTLATLVPLFFLASKYQTTRVLATLCPRLVEVLLAALAENRDTTEFEDLLSRHFLFCPIADLWKVPLEVLDRVIRFPSRRDFRRRSEFRSAFDRTFDLVMGAFEKFGSGAAALLGGLRRDQLNQAQKHTLDLHGDVGWPFLASSKLHLVEGRVDGHDARLKLFCCTAVVLFSVIAVCLGVMGYMIYRLAGDLRSEKQANAQLRSELGKLESRMIGQIRQSEQTQAESVRTVNAQLTSELGKVEDRIINQIRQSE